MLTVAFALRAFLRKPLAVLGAVFILTAGVGLAATTFALANPFLSKPLPYRDPERLVLIELDLAAAAMESSATEFPTLGDWQARTDLFASLGSFSARSPLRVQVSNRYIQLDSVSVSPNIFGVLDGGLGDIDDGDSELWLTQAALSGPLRRVSAGDALRSPDGLFLIRGILGKSFVFPEPDQTEPIQALVVARQGPIATVQRNPGLVRTTQLTLLGRLQRGVSGHQVETALNIAADGHFRVRVRPLAVAMKLRYRTEALGAVMAAILVVLVCITNTAGFSLTRSLYRSVQVETMEALGANPRQILAFFVAESGIVATATVVASIAVTLLAVHLVQAVVPATVLILGPPKFDWRIAVVIASAGLAGAVGWIVGALAAWRRQGLPSGRGQGNRETRAVRLLRRVTIACQVGITFCVLTASFLLGRAYLRLVTEDTGLEGATVAMSVSYPGSISGDELRSVVQATVADIRRLNGVRAAAAAVGRMVDDFNVRALFLVNGRPTPVDLLRVSDGYFDVTGMSFVKGGPRNFSDGDAVVVNETLAAHLLPPNVPLGTPVRILGIAPLVGIVRDARREALDRVAKPTAFLPLSSLTSGARVTYLVAARNGGEISIDRWVEAVYAHSKDAVIFDASSLRSRLMRSIESQAFAVVVVSLFGSATLLVTAAGLIGVVGYMVVRRTKELGIRLAVGASAPAVVWLVVKEVLLAASIGIAMGVVVSVWSVRLFVDLAGDAAGPTWQAIVAVTAFVLACSCASAIIPAMRAASLSPTVALREE